MGESILEKIPPLIGGLLRKEHYMGTDRLSPLPGTINSQVQGNNALKLTDVYSRRYAIFWKN